MGDNKKEVKRPNKGHPRHASQDPSYVNAPDAELRILFSSLRKITANKIKTIN